MTSMGTTTLTTTREIWDEASDPKWRDERWTFMKMMTMFDSAIVTLAVLSAVREQCRGATFISRARRPRGIISAGWGSPAGEWDSTTSTRPRPTRSTSTRASAGTNISRPSPRNRPASTWRARWPTRRKSKEFYKQNRERVLNSPEAREVSNGEALNRDPRRVAELQPRRIGLPLRADAGAHPRRHGPSYSVQARARKANSSRWIGYRSRGRARGRSRFRTRGLTT